MATSKQSKQSKRAQISALSAELAAAKHELARLGKAPPPAPVVDAERNVVQVSRDALRSPEWGYKQQEALAKELNAGRQIEYTP
jgi:hypothetical protein